MTCTPPLQVEAAKDAAAEMVEDQRQHIGKLKQVRYLHTLTYIPLGTAAS